VRIAFLLLSSVLLAGCSALFVTAPPATPSRSGSAPSADVEPECTTSAAAPIVDVVVAGLQAVRTGLALGASDADYVDFPISRGADIGIGATLAGVFAVSAVYGFTTTASCSDAKRDYHARRASEPELPERSFTPSRSPLPARAPAPAALECTYDAQCEGTRVCEQGRCVPYSYLPSP
jgi:hypothetical protein